MEFRSVKMSRTMFRPTKAEEEVGATEGSASVNPTPTIPKVPSVRRSLFGVTPSTSSQQHQHQPSTSVIATAHSPTAAAISSAGTAISATATTTTRPTLKSRTDVTNDQTACEDEDEAYTHMRLYQGLVKRSTRFTTTVPAVQVLRLIHEIIQNTPQRKTAANVAEQEVTVDFETYRIEVTRGERRLCRVRIFLMKAGMYMVEFIRDQLDIFQFKRFYENIRAKLTAIVKKDHSLQLLASHRPQHVRRAGGRRRKRSHSI